MSKARSSTRIGGMDPMEQVKIDEMMIDLDGTPNKARLGANAILGRVAGGGEGRGRRAGCRCIAMSAASMPAPCRCR